jgi:hypothetical protein
MAEVTEMGRCREKNEDMLMSGTSAGMIQVRRLHTRWTKMMSRRNRRKMRELIFNQVFLWFACLSSLSGLLRWCGRSRLGSSIGRY